MVPVESAWPIAVAHSPTLSDDWVALTVVVYVVVPVVVTRTLAVVPARVSLTVNPLLPTAVT